MRAAFDESLEALREQGFDGFQTLRDLRSESLERVPAKPGDRGVYLILRPNSGPPTFLEKSTGGNHKGRDPNVPLGVLHAKWVPGAQIIYIGQAGGNGSSETLRKRLDTYLRFGAGKKAGHWGGRYLWHLKDSETLVACWKTTPAEDPLTVERRMLREFVDTFGALPFANLK